MQATVWRRSLVVLVIFAVTAPLVVLDTTRVEASDFEAAESRCSVKAWEPETNGVDIWAVAEIDCGNVPVVDAVKISGRIQERVVRIWITRETTHNYGKKKSLSVFTKYRCNGHGTNRWRMRTTGYDSTEESRSDNSKEVTVTC